MYPRVRLYEGTEKTWRCVFGSELEPGIRIAGLLHGYIACRMEAVLSQPDKAEDPRRQPGDLVAWGTCP